MPADPMETPRAAIEHHLITSAGYEKGSPDAFDQERGLFPQDVISFIQETQPKEWEYLSTIQKDKAQATLLDDLCRALDSEHEGCLSVLRHGFKCFGKTFRMAYFAPASGMNPDTLALRPTACDHRQLRYCPSTQYLDVTLSLNGIPVATAEPRTR